MFRDKGDEIWGQDPNYWSPDGAEDHEPTATLPAPPDLPRRGSHRARRPAWVPGLIAGGVAVGLLIAGTWNLARYATPPEEILVPMDVTHSVTATATETEVKTVTKWRTPKPAPTITQWRWTPTQVPGPTKTVKITKTVTVSPSPSEEGIDNG